MVPDFGGIIWMFIAIIEAVIFIAVFAAFYFWVLPPLSRWLIRAKLSKRSVAFIQHAGKVHLCTSKNELPEGVIENKFGWFLKPTMPYKPEKKEQYPVKKQIKEILEKYADDPEQCEKELTNLKTSSGKKRGPPSNDEKAEEAALEILLETPILDGLNKHVLFGSTDTSLLGNLNTLSLVSYPELKEKKGKEPPLANQHFGSHAILNSLKALIPATMSRTQTHAIAVIAELRGRAAAGKDAVKVIIYAIAAISVVGTVGLVFWFLTQGGA